MDLRMETSQAVSMLQPFRHPKPGLTIMNKAEEVYNKKFHPEKVTVVSKATVIELMQQEYIRGWNNGKQWIRDNERP